MPSLPFSCFCCSQTKQTQTQVGGERGQAHGQRRAGEAHEKADLPLDDRKVFVVLHQDPLQRHRPSRFDLLRQEHEREAACVRTVGTSVT